MKYEELGEDVDDVEEERAKYKDAFVGNAEELCERSTGMGGKARAKSGMVDNRSRVSNTRKEGCLKGY